MSSQSMHLETLRFYTEGAVGVLTLNRPGRSNAMNRQMLGEFHQVLDLVEGDDAIRSLVLTGDDQSFCSGFDLKEQLAARPQGVAAWRPILQDDFDAIIRFWRLSKPTVAAVRGFCMASGLELALACDLTVASETSVFGLPELKFGAGIVVMILPWLIGAKKTKELILLGDDFTAPEAERMGLINRIFPAERVLAEAIRLAQRLAVVDPRLMGASKAAINRSFEIMGMGEALQVALDMDLLFEAEGSRDKAAFMEVVRRDGLRAALQWRDRRFEPV